MERHHLTFQSRVLERDVPYLWFGNEGRLLLLFPPSGGSFDENEERGLVDTLEDYIAEGRLQACCLSAFSEESWLDTHAHPRDRIRLHDRYDRFLSAEFLPLAAERTGRSDVALFGASLGGFHAVNFAARHPEQVARCIAFSGLFDCRRLLDGYWDELCYYHCPVAFVPNMNAEWVNRLRTVEWILAAGEYDSLADETHNFAGILRHKRIGVHSEIWPGVYGHDWPFWNEHLRRFLP